MFKNCIGVFCLMIVMTGCGGLQNIRADRVMPARHGSWTRTPTVLLHSSLNKEMKVRVIKQLTALQEQVGCGVWPWRQMTAEEETQYLIGQPIPNSVIVTVEDNSIGTETATFVIKQGDNFYQNQVYLHATASDVSIRHELAASLGGLGDNVNGDPSLLMSTNDYHNFSKKSKKRIDKVSNLLDDERQALCLSTMF